MQKLIDLYESWSGSAPSGVESIDAAGSNRQYFRLTGADGGSVIGVIGTSRDENHAFVYLSNHFKKRQLPVPRILAVAGDELRYLQEDLGRTSLFGAVSGGRDAGGRYNQKEKRLLVNTAVSFAVDAAVTYGLKYSIKTTRPDGTDRHSFPSGHTSFAFFGAAVLDKEFRHVSPWISVGGYAVAAFVGVDRVCRNRHHWGDVAAGAAIGWLSVQAGYWLGDKITGWGKNVDVAVCPLGVSVAWRL